MFRNLQIRSKLGAILVLPLAALIVFASFQVGSSVARRAEANRVNRLTGLAVRLTGLADALQQERAISSGYVASRKSGSYHADMMNGRAAVDRGTASLRKTLVRLDLSDYSQRLQTDLGDASRRLDGIGNWRLSLDGQSPPVVARVESFYGELLQSLLAVIADIGAEPGGKDVKADIAVLVEISRAKEAASQSTSLLFAALINRKFGPGEYQRFATLVGEEASSVARFDSTASPAQQILLEHKVAGASNSSLAEVMRQAALAGPEQPPALSPTVWLQTMSQKVAQFHQVELRVAADAAAAATADRNAAVRQTAVTTIAMLLVVALAVGLSLLLARSMAQPLYVLERAARDVAEQHLPGVVERLQRPDAQVDEASLEAMATTRAVPVRSHDEIGRVAEAFNSVHQVAIRTAAQQAALRSSIGSMFLNLARRSQRLVDRQLELIDDLEREEADPDALENLFKLDHLATRMRRNAEDLIVLSGAEPPRRWSDSVPLSQVVRGAVAEVEDYQRIELLPIDDVGVVGHAVADVIHLLAELLENATSFSPPGTTVRVAGQPAATGYVVEIEDRGLGMSDEELLDANQRLANPPMVDFAVSRMLGLFVVGRLAQRYGIRVQLRHSWYGGVTALVLVPSALLTWSAVQEQEELAAVRPELAPPAAATGGAAPTGAPVGRPAPRTAARPAPSGPQASAPPAAQAASGPQASVPGPRASVPPATAGAAAQGSATGGPAPPGRAAEAEPPPRSGDRLPIFEQARSDWFDSGGAGYLPLRRHAPQQPADDDDDAAVPLPQSVPAPSGPAPSGPAPSGPVPSGSAPSGSAPSGPGAASQRLTRTGLPRRVPRANLAPGISSAQTQPQPQPERPRPSPRPAASRSARSPEDVRAMLSSYRSGLERGRRMAAGPGGPDPFSDQPGGQSVGRGEDDEPPGFGSGPMASRSIDDLAE